MREHFPQIQDSSLIYFDTAATALKPQVVIDAISDFYTHHYGTVHRGIYKLCLDATDRYNSVRKKVAEFLNARSEEEIIFTKGTTESINLVAASIQPGDEVVISQLEHHSNIVPWQLAGAKLTVIPADEDGNLILKPFSPNTKLVSITHVSNAIGMISPIEKIIKMARDVGALVLIDGAQSAPHMPIDVQKLDCDFFAFSGHKLYGPTGIGVLYGKKESLEALSPYQGGGDMIEKVSFEKTTYNALPLRFEAGTPNIAGVIGLGAAIDFLKNKKEPGLLTYALQHLQQLPIKILGKPTTNICSFVAPGVHPLDIGTLLDRKNIAIRTGHHCAQPTMDHFGITSSCRVSFGLYNTKEEIDRFIFDLKNILDYLEHK